MLIGWDAADWKIINPLLDQGLMPNLERMVNNGTMGNLATMDPAYSPMLWTSIATGKHAYKHGIHGFLDIAKDRKSIKPVLSTSRKVKAIWEILSEKDYKCHVVGWWPSHPAEKMNGISISNFYQKEEGKLSDPWPMMSGTVYPESEQERFKNLRIHPEELTGQHILPFVPNADKIDQSRDRKLYNVAKVTAHAASIQAAFTNIIRNEEWDFSAVYFDSIDHYCHGFMKYHPPKRDHIPQHAFDLYKDVVTAGYRYHDMLLGRLIELAGDDATVMLISDHGFQSDHLRPKNIPEEPGGPVYEHSPYGIYAIKGPGIKKDHIQYGAELLDIAPTILAHFGLSIGSDMDGKVLVDSFEEKIRPSYIPSWEEVKFSKFNREMSYSMDVDSEQVLVEQLIALGYVEDFGKDMTKAIIDTENFNTYNLAKSYIYGGEVNEAINILEDLVKKNPHIPRYSFHLAVCYQTMGYLPQCRKMVDVLKQREYYNPIALDMMEATLLLGERKFIEALKLLESTKSQLDEQQPHVFAKIARCYIALGYFDKAEQSIDEGLELDYEFPSLHMLKGIIKYSLNESEQAIEPLLRSIGLEYTNASAHRYLGLALYDLGDYEAAADTLEQCLRIDPTNNLARGTLIEIYKTHLDNPQLAAKHRQLFSRTIKGEILVVSGLPRSGTSLMMQMLQLAGVDIYTDEDRKPDDNNKKGYYEHNNVKRLKSDKKWIDDCNGKAVKVISQLLPELPLNHSYKVIFMERDFDEVLISQQKMVKKLGKKVNEEVYPLSIINSFGTCNKRAKRWAEKQSHVEILCVQYRDVIEAPFAQAIRISEFLDAKIQPEDMIAAVDPMLYRERKADVSTI